MHQPTFNADPMTLPRAKWVLLGGVAAMVCGLIVNGSRLAFAFGAEPLLSPQLVDVLLEVLFAVYVLGIGVGYAGLGLLYDKRICYAIVALRVYFVLDLYLIGFASGESLLASLGMMLLIRGLEIAAMIMLFRVGKHRFLFLGVAIWLFLRLVLDFIPSDASAAIVGLLGASAYAVMFALAARAASSATAS